MALGDGPALLRVSVAFSPRAGEVDEARVLLPAGSMLREAVEASGLQARHPGHDVSSLPTGVWGVLAGPERLLRDHDRVELYRPLTVDPKEARRLRYRSRPGSAR